MEINKNIINFIKRNDSNFKNINIMKDDKLKK